MLVCSTIGPAVAFGAVWWLLSFDIAVFDHLGPFWNFDFDPRGKFLRGADDCFEAERFQFLLHVGLGESLADFTMQDVNDRYGCRGRNNDSDHGICLLIR